MPHRPGVDIGDRCLFERVQQNHVPPAPRVPRRCRPCACPVPALAPAPTDGLHRTTRPGACTASRPNTVNSASHRWHCLPARLFPPQIWDAPSCAARYPKTSAVVRTREYTTYMRTFFRGGRDERAGGAAISYALARGPAFGARSTVCRCRILKTLSPHQR